jgi:multiple sugar transport system permease protein
VTAAALATPRRVRTDSLVTWLLIAPAMLVLAGFYLYPTGYAAWISLTDLSFLHLRQGGDFIGLENYRSVLGSAAFWRVMWRTAFWLTAVSVAVRIVLGLALALLIESATIRRYRLRTVLRLALLVPWATPHIVAVFIWRWLLDPQVGTINKALVATGVLQQPHAFLADTSTVWAAIITIIVWNSLPIATVSFIAALQSVPRDLQEAAALDGAGRIAVFRNVTLPHIMPTVAIISMLLVFWTFNNFVYVWLTTGAGPGRYTDVLATDVYMRGFVDFQLGASATIGMIMAATLALFGVIYTRLLARRALAERL